MSLALRRSYAQHAYQKTLHLSKTKFPNRSVLANSLELLPLCSDRVYTEQLERFKRELGAVEGEDEKLAAVRERLFVLHDGPPYANGDLHLGHALNKILKDFVNRFQLSQGKTVYYRPGWDCHGLPIEMKALKDLRDADKMDSVKVRELARQHALRSLDKQRDQFKKYGILTDWSDPYVTMDKSFEVNQLKVFQKMFNMGLIKRQNKPVYWGTVTKTALAESELEYNEKHVSTAAYVKFPLTADSRAHLQDKLQLENELQNDQISCLIWTSTPWTLFSNRAICFNENFSYSLLQLDGSYVIVENNLINQLGSDHKGEILKTFEGKLLKGLFYYNPLVSDIVARPLIHGDHVTDNAGTGLVHTAPGHGHDDYFLGIENDLEIYSPVDHEGRYILNELPDNCKELLMEGGTGLGRKVLDSETTTVILDLLSKKQALLKAHKYTHSYPYDWRAKTPVIIRATPQWFADLHDVKDLAIKSLEKVEFYPKRGENRLSSFIKSRNEWCISRQRSWGVPIPVFHNKSNPDKVLINDELLEYIITRISKHGSDLWFSPEDDISDWFPENYRTMAKDFIKGTDTMDVWFDSGSTWNIIREFYQKELGLSTVPQPLANVYLEGSDQHRGWFQSSLLTKVACSMSEIAPYNEVITHGFTLDEKGIKMSKSIGNTISPESIIEGDKKRNLPALGIDGLRYFVAQADFTTDVTVGPTVLKHVAEALKKCRLTMRFLISNLEISKRYSLLNTSELRPVDKYVLASVNKLLEETKELYKVHNFSKVLVALQFHMNNELSSFYFDISKDSLYSDSIESLKRRQIQTTLFHIYDAYRAMLAPILPILVQESWNFLPKQWLNGDNDAEAVTRKWPSLTEINPEVVNEFKQVILPLVKEYKSKFATLGDPSITKPSQTKAIINCSKSIGYSNEELCDVLQTAEVDVNIGDMPSSNSITLDNGTSISIEVTKSEMHKCPRCWKHNSPEVDSLCHRCADSIASE
ncbi:Aminoacyl-transfer RNA synthetases class-I signature [Nakaseomyces glabratus]|nr:Aminoacyl-transfer RNA synthetases class-I signature [Nakaseomyces glabratus]